MKKLSVIAEPGGFGGTEIHTLNLIAYLTENKFNIIFFCCKNNVYENKIKKTENLKYIFTELSVMTKEKNELDVWQDLILDNKSEILIMPKGWNNIGSYMFLNLCRQHFKKIIFIEHSVPDPMPRKTSKLYFHGLIRGLGIWWYKEKLLRRKRSYYADKIISVSKSIEKKLIEECFYPRRKICTITNGIFLNKYICDNEKSNNHARNMFKIPQNAFVYGMLTRLSWEKGIDIALKSFSMVRKDNKDKDLFFAIVGEGKDEETFRKMAEELGINENTRFLGFVENVAEILKAFDVILFPSRKEGLPLALLEGMASGCIPIVSRIGDMGEVVNGREIGWVFEPENEFELYKAMMSVLELDGPSLALLKGNASSRIMHHYDAEKQYQNILKVIEK